MTTALNTSWSKLIGTSLDERSNAIAISGDGSIYVGGYTYGNLDGVNNNGNQDAFFSKYDSNGDLIWTKLFGNSSDSRLYSIDTSSDGSVYITGKISGDINGQTNNGSSDIFLAKYDSNGNIQWTNLIGTQASDQGRDVVIGNDGSIYITGFTGGNLNSETNSGGVDVFLSKYNSDGAQQWTQLLGESWSEISNCIDIDTDGNIYIAGETFLAKYNSNGIKQFATNIPISNTGYANDVLVSSDGKIYIVGRANGTIDDQTSSNNDAYIAQYDSNGTRNWTRFIGSSANDTAFSLAQGPNNTVYITAQALGEIDGHSASGYGEVLIASYSSDGTKNWSDFYGGSGDENPRGIETDSSGNIFLTGFTNGDLSGQTNNGKLDAFISKLSIATDTGDASFAISGTGLAGETLSISETSTDPEGRGALTYIWQSSSDNTNWSQVSTSASYTLTSSDENKKIRAIISYTDNQGFSESVTTTALQVNQKTYTITPSTSSINEGSTLTTSISTTNVAADTTLYWSLSGTGITSSDFSSGALTGSGTVDSNGDFSFAHTLADDTTTEGNETLNIKLFSDSDRTTQVGTTSVVTITDTSKTPTYTISPSTTSINEGETLTTSISTTNVATNTTLYYSLSGTGITSDDFSSGSLTGSGTVDSNGDFSFSHTLANDSATEGNETLNIKLFSDSSRSTSTQVGTTSVVTITDTSKTPTYTISPSTLSINEGETLTTSISTTNVATNTTLYYSLSGTGITSDDFSSGSLTGSGTVDSNGDFSFSHTLAKDLLNEGDEILEIKLFSDSARSTQVGETKSITIAGGSTIYTLSVDSPSVIEADTNTKVLTYRLTLDQEATERTNINYETLTTGTATSGEDFISAAGVVIFLEGQKVATLNITINGDVLLEDDETVKVKFSSSKLKEDLIATGTITNNDIAASSYSASVDEPSILETDSGTKTLAFTITLDQEVSETTNINYQTLTSGTATTGEDFVTSAGVVTFVKGQKVATLNISVNGDADVESDETIQVKFSGAALSSEVIATGTIKDNDIAGTNANDNLNGSTGNDNLKGGGGSDVIDGGAGIDTATYTGKFNDYTITKTTTTIQITDIRITSPDGVDTVQNIEYVQFTDQLVASDKINVVKTFSGNFRDYKFYNKGDGTYEIKDSSGTTDDITGIPKLTFEDKTGNESVSAIADIKAVFDQVTGKETPSGEMFRLYNAAFARFPDASGLEYWIDKFSSGTDDARAVASSFLVSDEFSERYGSNVTNAKYVETLYVNVLGREYDQEGYNYWLGNLNSGLETRYELLLGFAEADENKALFTEMTGLG